MERFMWQAENAPLPLANQPRPLLCTQSYPQYLQNTLFHSDKLEPLRKKALQVCIQFNLMQACTQTSLKAQVLDTSWDLAEMAQSLLAIDSLRFS